MANDEILIKFKIEQGGLEASFKEIQNNLTNKVNNLESELSNKFKEVAKQSGGALDPFIADIDEIVKDSGKLKIITKIIEGNAAALDKNSKEFKSLNGLLKEFNSKSLELSRAKKSFEEIGNEVEKINAKPLTFFDKMKNSSNEIEKYNNDYEWEDWGNCDDYEEYICKDEWDIWEDTDKLENIEDNSCSSYTQLNETIESKYRKVNKI
jgi:hypothetical protein